MKFMKTSELKEIKFKYVSISLWDTTVKYVNDNFESLLDYIGVACKKPNKSNIQSAYIEIRNETNKLLDVRWNYNRNLRVSRREINSIRNARYKCIAKKNNHFYLRIPYKIGFIFIAINNILNRIENDYPIPQNLKGYIGLPYGSVFYQKYITEYDNEYEQKFKYTPQEEGIINYPKILFDEFHVENSIFNKKFAKASKK